jgi:hypothetical protein
MLNQPKFLALFGIIVISGLFNAWYFAVNAETFSSGFHIPTWVVYIPVSLFFLVVLGIGFKALRKETAKIGHDDIRKQHLNNYKEGFKRFFSDYGYYPKSNIDETYNSRFIRIPKEWDLFQFPNHEEMWKYIQNWPLLDPSFDVKNPNKSNYYLYKVSEDAQHFAVYANLDNSEDSDVKDYSALDHIDPSVGTYNYKVGQ